MDPLCTLFLKEGWPARRDCLTKPGGHSLASSFAWAELDSNKHLLHEAVDMHFAWVRVRFEEKG